MIETSLLQTLVAVGKAQSFSKAATDLKVTQSAISQSVKNLEKKVGVKLIARSGKKFNLTSEGKKLFDIAEEFLSKIGTVLQDVRECRDGMTGSIKIGSLSGIGKSWLCQELINFAVDFPEINIELDLDLQKSLVSRFENFELDCLIVPENELPTIGESEVLDTEKATLVVPNSLNFRIDNDITLENLLEFPLILFDDKAPLFFRWCREKYGEEPKHIEGRFTVNSHGGMLHAVSKGLGIAVIPNHVLTRSFYRDKVRVLNDSFTCVTNKILYIYHKDAIELTRMHYLKNALVNSISNLNE